MSQFLAVVTFYLSPGVSELLAHPRVLSSDSFSCVLLNRFEPLNYSLRCKDVLIVFKAIYGQIEFAYFSESIHDGKSETDIIHHRSVVYQTYLLIGSLYRRGDLVDTIIFGGIHREHLRQQGYQPPF